MTNLSRRGFIVGVGLLTAAPTIANAGFFTKDRGIFVRRGRALGGTDPVAYFTDAIPVKGNKAHTTEWMDAIWTFASAENRQAFENDPAGFAPQYGGYCAWAVSQNYTASTDPDAWRIVDGKLYLNYSKGVQRTWEGDIAGNIVKGDTNWPGLLADLLA